MTNRPMFCFPIRMPVRIPAAVIGLGAMLALVLPATHAAAAIRCEDGFQVQRSGNRIATPYCEDQLVADVARRYGLRVSAAAIRNSVSEKIRVCRAVGQDSRLQNICRPLIDDRGNSRWR